MSIANRQGVRRVNLHPSRRRPRGPNQHSQDPPVMMLCCLGFRPEGAEQISPGQRPGNGNSREKRALKGRNKGLAMLRPYGLGRMRCNGPRAMPGADLWLPLRGAYTRPPLQIRWLLNDVAEFRDAPMRASDRRLSHREGMDPFAERKTLGWRRVN